MKSADIRNPPYFLVSWTLDCIRPPADIGEYYLTTMNVIRIV